MRAKGLGAGRHQRARYRQGKSHTPDLARYYRHSLPDLHPGRFAFHLSIVRPKLDPIPLPTVEYLSWDDEQSTMTGSFTAHRPDPRDPSSLPLRKGQLVACEARVAGQRHQLWTMRCGDPQWQLDQNTVTVNLLDDMALVKAGQEDWYFRKTKGHSAGWTAAEITQFVADRRGFKLKMPLPKCTKRFVLTKRKSSAYQVLVDAWGEERKAAGVPFVMRFRNGELEVTTLRRNPVLYVLGGQIQTALLQDKKGDNLPFTVLEARGKVGKGKSAKRVWDTEYDRRAIRVLGYIRQVKDFGTVDSLDDLRKRARRDLADQLKVKRMITIQGAGIPFILRGDGVKIDLPSEGYKGDQSFVWCSRANHTVQGGTYSTEWDFVLTDLFLRAENRAKRAAKAAAGKGSGGTGSGTGGKWRVPASAEDDPPGALAACGPLPADRRGYSVLSLSGTSGDAGSAGQALGGGIWPCGARLVITNPANGKSVVASHVDNGAGSDAILPVVGLYPQTRADLGLSGGSFEVVIQSAGGSRPIAPVRGTQV